MGQSSPSLTAVHRNTVAAGGPTRVSEESKRDGHGGPHRSDTRDRPHRPIADVSGRLERDASVQRSDLDIDRNNQAWPVHPDSVALLSGSSSHWLGPLGTPTACSCQRSPRCLAHALNGQGRLVRRLCIGPLPARCTVLSRAKNDRAVHFVRTVHLFPCPGRIRPKTASGKWPLAAMLWLAESSPTIFS